MKPITNQSIRAITTGCLSWLGLGVICLGSSTLVNALPANEVEITYYRDAQKTEEVGYMIMGCQGDRVQSGQKTRYTSRSSTPCNASPQPPDNSGSLPCEFLQAGCSSLPTRR